MKNVPPLPWVNGGCNLKLLNSEFAEFRIVDVLITGQAQTDHHLTTREHFNLQLAENHIMVELVTPAIYPPQCTAFSV